MKTFRVVVSLAVLLVSQALLAEIPIKSDVYARVKGIIEVLDCNAFFTRRTVRIRKLPMELQGLITLKEVEDYAFLLTKKMLLPQEYRYETDSLMDQPWTSEIDHPVFEATLATIMHEYIDFIMDVTGLLDTRLKEGKLIPSLIIGIHPLVTFQQSALKYLSENEFFANSPWIQLYSREYYINQLDENTLNASAIRYSPWGEILDLNFATPHIHVFGGCYGSCLSKTILQAANIALDHDEIPELKVIVHTELSYKSTTKSLDEEVTQSSNALETYRNGLAHLVTPIDGNTHFRLLGSKTTTDAKAPFVFWLFRIKDEKRLTIQFVRR